MKNLTMLLISSSRAVAQISSCFSYVGREMNSNKFLLQGSKQVPSSSPGQVDFLAGQVTFKATLTQVKTTDRLIKSLTKTRKRRL